jgi:hypothetical protein
MNGSSIAQWAIIAVIVVILAIIFVNSRRRFNEQDRLEQLSGKIDQPVNNASLGRSIPCRGSVRGTARAPEARYYLAFESSELIYPQDPPLKVGTDGRWSATLREADSPERFSITLWAVPPTGVEHIQIWLDNGRRTGEYPGLTVLPDAQRLAEVCGLSLEAES